MKVKNILVTFFILTLIWILLNNNLTIEIIVIGASISLFVTLLLCRKCNVFDDIKITPKSFIFTILYLFVFIIELVKSNIDVAIRVLKPSLPINPGIVKVQTSLKSKMGRMLLANSITLTPGTLTIDIKDDILYIHWIDVTSSDIEGATNAIVKKFEKYLKEIYD